MRMFRAMTVAAAMAAACTGAQSKSSITDQDRQQAACADDVQRLCPDTIPDIEATAACMKDKRAMVHAECAKLYFKHK